jgi:hypothetical protein
MVKGGQTRVHVVTDSEPKAIGKNPKASQVLAKTLIVAHPAGVRPHPQVIASLCATAPQAQLFLHELGSDRLVAVEPV